MNELKTLAGLYADLPEPTEERLAPARERLMAEVAGRPAARRPLFRRPATWLAAGALATAMSVGLMVLTTSGEEKNPVVPRTQAEAALVHAAEVAEANPDPVPRMDQFVYSTSVKRNGPPGGPWNSRRLRSWSSVDGRRYGMTIPDQGMSDGKPGELIETEMPGGGRMIVWGYPELARLPREPRALINALAKKGSVLPGPNAEQNLFEILSHPVLPPGLRPAAFRALSLIPGIEMRDGVKDAIGRPGVGVLRPRETGRRSEFIDIYDPKTFRYLGYRNTYVEDVGRDGVKKGEPITDWGARTVHGIVDRPGQKP